MLLLTEHDVEESISARDCVEPLRAAYRALALGEAAQFPPGGRMDVGASIEGPEVEPQFWWAAMAAVIPGEKIFALRQRIGVHHLYPRPGGGQTRETRKGCYSAFVILISTETATPVALLPDGAIQHMRVGATAAVGASYMARADSKTLGIIGSSGMARTHAEAISAVRPIETIQVYSSTKANREAFAEAMSERLGLRVVACDSAEAALDGADIVSFCTNSNKALMPDESWVRPGMHIVSVLGSEIGNLGEVVDRAFIHQDGAPVGEWANLPGTSSDGKRGIGGSETSHYQGLLKVTGRMPTLPDLVVGKVKGRESDDEVNYYYNTPGNGLQFAAVGAELYRRVLEAGRGVELPDSWVRPGWKREL